MRVPAHSHLKFVILSVRCCELELFRNKKKREDRVKTIHPFSKMHAQKKKEMKKKV